MCRLAKTPATNRRAVRTDTTVRYRRADRALSGVSGRENDHLPRT